MYRSNPVTKAMLASHLGISPDAVKQIDNKQLFVVNGQYLYSYYTKVGRLLDGVWYLTTIRYSNTTSKQLSQFARARAVEWVDELP